MKFICLLPLCALTCSPLQAQLNTFGSTDMEQIDAVCYDASGNVYYFGEFDGTTDFDPSDGPDASDTFTATTPYDAGFVASYTSAGAFRWAFPLAGTEDLVARGMDIDPSGNIFISGEIEGSFDFDPGPGTQNRVGDNNDDVFVASYTSAGAFRFANLLQSTTADDGNAVVADPAGNCYFTGEFRATIDFDPGVGVESRTPAGSKDGFLVSYDATGAFRWVRQFGASGNVSPLDLDADDAGNVFILGQLDADIDLDDSDGADASDFYSSAGGADGFLASFTSTGDYRFGFPIGSPLDDTGIAISENGGRIYCIGIAGAGVDFDPGPGTFDPFNVGQSRFLACYDTNGGLQFAVAQGFFTLNFAIDVLAVDDGIYITGRVDPATGPAYDLAPYDPQNRGLVATDGDSRGYLFRLENDGTPVWARVFGNPETRCINLAAAPGGGAHVVGYFKNTADFDPGPGLVEATSSGDDDALGLIIDEDGLYPGTSPPSYVVTNTNDSGPGSLRYVLTAADITPLPDTITFAIPGAGPHTISPASPLPISRFPLKVDGLTQPGTNTAIWPPELKVILDGALAGAGAHGLDITIETIVLLALEGTDTETLIRGLVVNGFDGYGISAGEITLTHCLIGTSVDGMSAVPNGAGGVNAGGDIGIPGAGNLISGNTGPGIRSNGSSLIRSNWIGVAADGLTPLGNGGDGILQGTTIGGTAPGDSNRIWFNGGSGVNAATFVLGNSIKGNAALGIDAPGGSPLDVAFSQIDSALNDDGLTVIEGTFDAEPGAEYRLEFFIDSTSPSSGFGQGDTLLAVLEVDAFNGNPDFRIEVPALPPGTTITATATEKRTAIPSSRARTTSGFSLALPVELPDVTTTADAGPGSLRNAIATANANPGPDEIVLSPSLSGRTILLSSPLPIIIDALTLKARPGTIVSGQNLHPGFVIDAASSPVTIENLIIENGLATQGGGIRVVNGEVALNKVTIKNCEATAEGGGLAMLGGDVRSEDCRFSSNVAGTDGGGLAHLAGSLDMDRCTFDGNSAGTSGGGIYFTDSVPTQPRLDNITLTGNLAATGGGMHTTDLSSRKPFIRFMTVTGNTATAAIGGVSGTVSMEYSVVAGNTPEVAPTLSDPAQSADNTFGGNPQLGPLRDNGGFVPTHAILTGSPLRNASASPSGSFPDLDARRGKRISGVIGDSGADHGAFEYAQGGFIEDSRDFDAWDHLALPFGQQGPNDDPNNDGIDNLLSHHFGVHPLNGGGRLPIDTYTDSSGQFRLTWSAPLYRPGNTVTSKVGSNLLALPPGPAPVELGSSTSRAFFEIVYPSSASAEFGRLEVTQAP